MDGGKTILTCPKCGPVWLLTVRFDRTANETFLACERRPHCDYRQEMPEHVLTEHVGAPRLPGL